MKKVVALCMIMSVIYALIGCNTKHLSVEQSKKNFTVYQEAIQKIVYEYGYKMVETQDENFHNQDGYKDLSIIINDVAKIEIRICNTAYNKPTGVESFTIEYFLNDGDIQNQFDTNFFVELVNSISGKSLSKEFCDSFLTAPEEKYAATRHGFKKLNGEKIAKTHFFNFFEDWAIFYKLSKENEEILSYGGLTKQLNT